MEGMEDKKAFETETDTMKELSQEETKRKEDGKRQKTLFVPNAGNLFPSCSLSIKWISDRYLTLECIIISIIPEKEREREEALEK